MIQFIHSRDTVVVCCTCTVGAVFFLILDYLPQEGNRSSGFQNIVLSVSCGSNNNIILFDRLEPFLESAAVGSLLRGLGATQHHRGQDGPVGCSLVSFGSEGRMSSSSRSCSSLISEQTIAWDKHFAVWWIET
jgi:hypothetical protein